MSKPFVAIGKASAKNAAYLATQILATSDAGLAERAAKDTELQASLKK